MDIDRTEHTRAWERASEAPPLVGRDDLPAGVSLHRLQAHPDERGQFTELFRREWELEVDPVQWNIVRSEAGVLRGVHVHPRHDDYLTIVSGRAAIGLRDLRRESPTADRVAVVELSGARADGDLDPARRRPRLSLSRAVDPLLRGLALLAPQRRARLSLGRPRARDPLARAADAGLSARRRPSSPSSLSCSAGALPA